MILQGRFDDVISCEQSFTFAASQKFLTDGILSMLAASVSGALQLLLLVRMIWVCILKEFSSQFYMLHAISARVDHIQAVIIKLGAHDLINVGFVL